MTQDEIIRMALEAGFTDIEATALEYFYQAVFAAGSAHEREACAKVCEDINNPTFEAVAAAIRARGNDK